MAQQKAKSKSEVTHCLKPAKTYRGLNTVCRYHMQLSYIEGFAYLCGSFSSTGIHSGMFRYTPVTTDREFSTLSFKMS